MEYSYPLNPDWTTEEMIAVVAFFEAVEAAYEKGILREKLMEKYNVFKKIVPSQGEEKSICRDYEKACGYVPYKVVKLAKQMKDGEIIRM